MFDFDLLQEKIKYLVDKSYQNIDILGVTYNINSVISIRNHVVISSDDNIITVYHNKKTDYIVVLQDFFIKSCTNYVNQVFLKVQNKMSAYNLQAQYPPKYRFYKGRWGACRSNTGEIFFNYSLYHLSPALIEHVVLHEFCHLKYPNHSKDFYDFLAKFDIFSKVHNQRIRGYGHYVGYFELFNRIK